MECRESHFSAPQGNGTLPSARSSFGEFGFGGPVAGQELPNLATISTSASAAAPAGVAFASSSNRLAVACAVAIGSACCLRSCCCCSVAVGVWSAFSG